MPVNSISPYAIDHALRIPRNMSTITTIISDLGSMPDVAPFCTKATNISRAVVTIACKPSKTRNSIIATSMMNSSIP